MRFLAFISGAAALAAEKRINATQMALVINELETANVRSVEYQQPDIVGKYKLAQNGPKAAVAPHVAADPECDEEGNCKEKPAEINAHGWRIGKWPDCPSPCSGRKSQRYRDISCTKPDGNCGGERPSDHEVCYGVGNDCGAPLDCKSEEEKKACKARVYGKDYRQGWVAEFGPGMYNYTLMEKAGATCQDISSIEVVGDCCVIQVFDYGDCNKKWANGFSASFGFGRYDQQEIQDAGASNNDISCIIVRSSAFVVSGVVALVLSFF